MHSEDDSETAIFAEPYPVDTILATDTEAVVVGEHVFLTYFAARPEYFGHELHVTKVVVARIAYPLAAFITNRPKVMKALAMQQVATIWPDAKAGHG